MTNKRWLKAVKEAEQAIILQALLAYKQQRDPIGDSDLYAEQPITISVTTRLGVMRNLDMHYSPKDKK